MISMAISMNHLTLAMKHNTLESHAKQVDITFVRYTVCFETSDRLKTTTGKRNELDRAQICSHTH